METVETQHKAPVIDILEALKMSLAEVKKPIRSSTGTAAAPVEEDRSGKKGPQSRRIISRRRMWPSSNYCPFPA